VFGQKLTKKGQFVFVLEKALFWSKQ